MYATLSLPFVDADRRNPSRGDGDGEGVSTRARIAVAFVVWVGLWLLLRANDYFGLLR